MSHLQALEREVLSWPEVTAHDHRFGGAEYRLGKREIGHYHEPRDLLDIPFPQKVRDELIDTGEAEKHHVLPESGWVSYRVREQGDVEHAIELLRHSYELARAQAERRTKRAKVD